MASDATKTTRPPGLARLSATGPAAGPSRTRLLTGRIMRTPNAPVVYKARPAHAGPGKAVGSFVPRIAQKAFEKYGFSTAALLTDWAQIAGADLARYTMPERLKWPRGVETFGEVDASGKGRPGATLILKVDPARALDIQYKAAQLIERINVYFGYKAVTDLRILQAPVEPRGPSAASRTPPVVAATATTAHAALATAAPALATVTDDKLRAALERMSAGIASRKRSG